MTLLQLAAAPALVDVKRRIIAGVLVPPAADGVPATGRTSVGPARFHAASLAWTDPRRVVLLREHQRAEALGFAIELGWFDDGSLQGRFHLPPSDDPATEAERLRALADAASGVRAGLSVGAEFDSTGVVVNKDGSLDVYAGRLRETSLVSVPAFDDSRVTSVAATAQGGTMDPVVPTTPPAPAPAPAPEPAPAPAPAPAPGPVSEPQGLTASAVLDELMDRLRSGQLAPVAPAGGQAPPPAGAPGQIAAGGGLDLQGFVDLVASAHQAQAFGDPSLIGELTAALTDITPTNQGGGPGVQRSVYLDELWSGTDYVRKVIDNAYTPRPLPRALKFTGHRWQTRPIVDDYAGDKADVPTNLPQLVDVDVEVKRLAGAHDVDRAFFDLGSPDWLASYFEAQTEDYRMKSDARAATALWNGATTIADGNGAGAGEAATLLGGVAAAIVELATGGEGASYVGMAPGLIAALFAISRQDAPAFFDGSFQLSGSGDGALGGLTFFTSPGIPANGFITGQKTAARWHEQTPPIRVQAVNVAQGGIDLGVFGYYAAYVRNPAQVRKGTIAPAA